ncbi:reverse transcriptase domain-containing protein [Tanacetum coccineum]|uniref:Reverse transcriptase domain-containing protein n=1 Tax=Tanacetum coccineum TaxID=301880 RepID=A0ABQ5H4N9_9ASTR
MPMCHVIQARPLKSTSREVKRFFKYLRVPLYMGTLVPKDSGFETNSIFRRDQRCIDTRKSTSEDTFLGDKLTQFKLWLHTSTKYRWDGDSQSAIAFSMQPRTSFANKAHPYSDFTSKELIGDDMYYGIISDKVELTMEHHKTGVSNDVLIMPPRMRTQSAGRPAAESLGGGMGERVGRCGRGSRPREGNDERVDELNGQGNDQGMGANGGVEGVNGNVEGANGGAPDLSMIIAQQLQNLLPAMLAQVSNQGNVGNQNGNVVNENVQENVGNVIVYGNQVGCSYKEFLACNPKEYDGKGGVVVLTRWIEKMEFVHDMSGYNIDQKLKYIVGSFVGKALTWWNSQIRTLNQEVVVSMSWNDFKFIMVQEFCPSHEMQKLESELWNHTMVRAGHAAYTDRFHELARLVSHLVTPKSRMIKRYVYDLAPQICGMVVATEPKTIQKVVQISGTLTDEVVRNGSIKKVEKTGNVGEPSKDNKRTRTVNAFATTVNPVGRENTGMDKSKITRKQSKVRKTTIIQRVPRTESNLRMENVQCYNCNEKGHYARDCQKPRVHDAKYFREQILLAMKDEAGSNLKDEENDFMLDNSYGVETLEELTTKIIMIAQIQPADDNTVTEPIYE